MAAADPALLAQRRRRALDVPGTTPPEEGGEGCSLLWRVTSAIELVRRIHFEDLHLEDLHLEDLPANEGPWRGLHGRMTGQGRRSPCEQAIWQLDQLWLERVGDRLA